MNSSIERPTVVFRDLLFVLFLPSIVGFIISYTQYWFPFMVIITLLLGGIVGTTMYYKWKNKEMFVFAVMGALLIVSFLMGVLGRGFHS